MRYSYKKLVVIFIGVWFLQNMPLQADNSFIIFYKRLNKATYHKNFQQLLSILSNLDSFNTVRFGGGLGPNDKNSLQLITLQAIQKTFLDKTGKLKDFNINENFIDNEKKWFQYLSIKPDDYDKVLSLLQNKQVTVRMLGILKAMHSNYNSKLIKALQYIVKSDQYVIIEYVYPQGEKKEKNSPPRLGGFYNGFSCPLRNAALQVLQKNGIEASVNLHNVNIQGLNYLMNLYKNSNNLNLKEEIITTILPFESNSLAIFYLFEKDIFDKKYNAVIQLFRAKYKTK